jgi:NAD(P)-dependent dehydrogenase (short-subunit alcohol dehydrogenase family)
MPHIIVKLWPGKSEEQKTRLAEDSRAGRPEEIAAAVLWLCGPAASYIIGQAHPLDGGMTVV